MSTDREQLIISIEDYPGGFAGKIIGKTSLGASRVIYVCNHKHRSSEKAKKCAMSYLEKIKKGRKSERSKQG